LINVFTPKPYLGSTSLCTTSDNDQIILCGHNNFVVINFIFSKDKFKKKLIICHFVSLVLFYTLDLHSKISMKVRFIKKVYNKIQINKKYKKYIYI